MQWDGYLIGGITLIFCLLTSKSKIVPTAFIVFVVGIIIAAVRMANNSTPWDSALTVMHTVVPTRNEWITGMYIRYATSSAYHTTELVHCRVQVIRDAVSGSRDGPRLAHRILLCGHDECRFLLVWRLSYVSRLRWSCWSAPFLALALICRLLS